MRITVRGKQNYWRFTVHSWLLEIRDILESELGERVEVEVIDGENEDPEILVNEKLIGAGVPEEEGYLIEIIKKAALMLKER